MCGSFLPSSCLLLWPTCGLWSSWSWEKGFPLTLHVFWEFRFPARRLPVSVWWGVCEDTEYLGTTFLGIFSGSPLECPWRNVRIVWSWETSWEGFGPYIRKWLIPAHPSPHCVGLNKPLVIAHLQVRKAELAVFYRMDNGNPPPVEHAGM
ncbi:hypothetical protein HOY80DRAFT_983640 [Tuber brumale]|nr:hypothetical protein HOY80DRAFT_983640 [Tuber brumale]